MYKARIGNKYGAKKTVFNGHKYDSKFEAGVAKELEVRKIAGEIKDYEKQYKVRINIYNAHGDRVHEVTHKVDFRIHEHDGSFTLLEAKGVETTDYRFRRMLLEKVWLPENLDHVYEVVYQRRGNVRR